MNPVCEPEYGRSAAEKAPKAKKTTQAQRSGATTKNQYHHGDTERTF
jgi:hypothetical protein